jgi:hypothetical protein
MLHRRDDARFPPGVRLGIQVKEFNLGFIRPENLVSHGLRVFRCLLAKSKRAVMCLLLRSGYWWSTAEMGERYRRTTISIEELWSTVKVTIRFLVT